jgi:hypothetical protein
LLKSSARQVVGRRTGGRLTSAGLRVALRAAVAASCLSFESIDPADPAQRSGRPIRGAADARLRFRRGGPAGAASG